LKDCRQLKVTAQQQFDSIEKPSPFKPPKLREKQSVQTSIFMVVAQSTTQGSQSSQYVDEEFIIKVVLKRKTKPHFLLNKKIFFCNTKSTY
jgi:hypothetical protein